VRVRFRLEAAEDVEGARAWYDEQQGGLGDAFVASLEDVVRLLANSQKRFPRSRSGTGGHSYTGSRMRCTTVSTVM
jgi:predicted alpha/beta superfamily hydrolase